MAANALADHWEDARDSYDLPAEVADVRDQEELDRRIVLFELVDRLSDAQRRVIQMRFVDGKSIREIAAALSWFIATHLGGSSVPEGLRSVTPFVHAKAAAQYIEFLKRAFGAVEEARHDTPDGRVMYAAAHRRRRD
jgi:hypothetical protein